MILRTLLFVLPAFLIACKPSQPSQPEAATKPAQVSAEPNRLDGVPLRLEPTPTDEEGRIRVEANAEGFSPARIHVEEGKAVKLLFERTVERTCMDGVVFPSLDLKEDLEVGEPVLVEFTPEASGEIAFHCPMGHGKSSVVVLPRKS